MIWQRLAGSSVWPGFHTNLPWMIWQRPAEPGVWPGPPYTLTLNYMTKARWTQCLTGLPYIFTLNDMIKARWTQCLTGLPYIFTLNDMIKARWTQCLTRASIHIYVEWYDKCPLDQVLDKSFNTYLRWMIWQRPAGPSVRQELQYIFTLNDMTKARWTHAVFDHSFHTDLPWMIWQRPAGWIAYKNFGKKQHTCTNVPYTPFVVSINFW